MSQSLVKNLIHLVYSTKHRQPWIPRKNRDGLFAYQAGIFKQWDSPALVIGGVEHHRRTTFQDELRAFCRRHGVEFDERYVCD
jgi:hypothetical protein